MSYLTKYQILPIDLSGVVILYTPFVTVLSDKW